MRTLLRDKNGEVPAMLGGVIALMAVIIIGILVYYSIVAGVVPLSTPGYSSDALNNTNTTANTVFTLAPIIALVVISSIILGVVSNFGRNQA